MAFTKEEIEYYHDMGLLPDRYYYQMNGAPAYMNYNRQHKRFLDQIAKRQEQIESNKKLEKQVEKQVDEKLDKSIEKALQDLLKDFNFDINITL